jgi:heme/copper-type cytochrome/quinol oxidase subunit 2
MWTGQRIEKFYDLLVKDVIASGDIEKVDTKENRQRCRQIHYDFKGSWFYCKAYITQTAVKLVICVAVLAWSLFNQCNQLRESFHTTFECRVFDYTHECSIPSNGMNMVIFDMCNIVLFMILIVASCNLYWHLRFKRSTMARTLDSNVKHNFIKRNVCIKENKSEIRHQLHPN